MLEVEAEAVPRDMSTGSGDAEVPVGRRLDQLSGAGIKPLTEKTCGGLHPPG